MKNFFDKLGAIFLGIFILIVIEGLISFGQFLKFEEYNWLAWAMQFMAVYVTGWAAVRIQEANKY